MIAAERRARIKKMLLERRFIKVSELTKVFDVSDETIRRDLDELEKEGILKKNYGGAVLTEDSYVVPPLRVRNEENLEEKMAIGRKMAEIIDDGSFVILDAGSTTLCVARALRDKSINVLTNDLNISYELSNCPNINVFITGGLLKKETMSLIGPEAVRNIQVYNASAAIIGTGGITFDKGFTAGDTFEAEVKRAMMSSSDRVIIVADSSKINKRAMVSFADISEVDEVVIAGQVDVDFVSGLADIGIKVITC
ncbi:DeoR/GlpR family DNA-binding transcription regulator [Calorimonas adulescens]|uniref:DeoR/GlpR transcriptional regulator n=1 Tax=Calorimonas adulescens TaxID=2606906 RepID=A0A5D8QE25_9THEO|nr:DeoR/GlpR family DNA-binding transcription regulator [Calorimonas adulescens]TZE81508.1 DeoR/GlpR transcriptional regulator [Calorimonas adulescens]